MDSGKYKTAETADVELLYVSDATAVIVEATPGTVDHAHAYDEEEAEVINAMNPGVTFDYDENAHQNELVDVYHHVSDAEDLPEGQEVAPKMEFTKPEEGATEEQIKAAFEHNKNVDEVKAVVEEAIQEEIAEKQASCAHEYDANGVCKKCGYSENAHKHTYVYVSNGDGTHTGTCECGKTTDAEACDFSGWNHDKTQHWHACKVCQADSDGEKENHTWSLDYDDTDSSNHCTTCGRFRWTAEIGNIGYETLKEAIEVDLAASKVDGYKGTLITMLNNEDITVNQYATIQVGQKITLNLNGCVINQDATGLNSSSKVEQTHVIVNKGTLIVNDSSKNKTGKIYSYSANADWGAGHYTIDNASGTLTINGGTFHNKVGTSGLCMNLHTGSYGASPVTTINGGTFIGGYSTVLYNNNSGAPTLNINGGTFKGTVYLQFATSNAKPGMILNISGGTFDNHTMSGCILVAGQPDTVGVDGSDLEISITGGNFIVGDDYYETGCVLNCNAGTVSDVDDGYISGGYFNFNVNKRELVAGKYTVPNTDVSNNDVYYFTVGNASYKVSHTVSQYVLVGSLDDIDAEIAAGTTLYIDFAGLYGTEYNNVTNRYLDINDDTISAGNYGANYTGKVIYNKYCKRGVYNDAGYAGRCVCKIQDVTYDFYFADSDSADAFIATNPSIVFTKTTIK